MNVNIMQIHFHILNPICLLYHFGKYTMNLNYIIIITHSSINTI